MALKQQFPIPIPLRIVIKALIVFAAINLIFAAVDPIPVLGKISVYNWLVTGRTRLPYGENPEESYNLSIDSLDAMFASHRINGTAKAADEYRVLLIGDSSVWGVLLDPDETLDAYLNAANVQIEGKRARFYNLGYPVQSISKDRLILEYARRYQPDLIVWLVTLESFAPGQRSASQLVKAQEQPRSFWENTLIGRRREVADWLRLQLYGFNWAATGIDQVYPKFYEPRMENFREDNFPDGLEAWKGFSADRQFERDDLAFEVLLNAADVPVIVVNEPMFISDGLNSEVRYNFFYPRWAYDRYRELFASFCAENALTCLDLWNAVPSTEFTDSAVHLTPTGSRLLAELLATRLTSAIVKQNT